MRTQKTAKQAADEAVVARLAAGDYLCSDTELYYVEHVGPKRIVLEECRTATLLDISLADAAPLRRVTPA